MGINSHQQTDGAAEAPRVSIIILSYNAVECTRECVESLRRFSDVPYEVIMVDNASGPETVAYLKTLEDLPGFRVIYNRENRGFAAGNNQALADARGEYILFLNNDTVLTPRWLSNLTAVMDRRRGAGAAGPRSNHASGSQGDIFLPSLAAAEIESFGAYYNFSDPNRWFEEESLSGYALMVRRRVLDEAGGFDERFEIGTAEDRDLCQRIRALGYTLVCAGDTFIFHAGHRSFLENNINFVAENIKNRLMLDGSAAAASAAPAEDDPGEGQVVRGPAGRYLFSDGMLWPLSSQDALRLAGSGAPQADLSGGGCEKYRVGAPVFCARGTGPEVYLVVKGERRLLTGDQQRVRLIRGITVFPDALLRALPEGEPIQVDDRLPAVPDRPAALPRSPMADFEKRCLSLEEVVAAIEGAMDAGRGLSLVRLGSGEAIVLNQGMWPVNGFNTAYSGVRLPNEPFREKLTAAIRGADLVGITPERRYFHCAPLLEKLFDHFNLYPRRLCSAFVNWDLIGVDRENGRVVCEDAPLWRLAAGRRVALVGRMAEEAQARLAEKGCRVTVSLALEGEARIEPVFEELKARRGEYDLALVSAGIPADVLCPRMARELQCVAIDFGHALNFLVNPNFNEQTLVREKLVWRVEDYIRACTEPRGEQYRPHPLNGKFVLCNESRYYVEDNQLRPGVSSALLDFFGAEVETVNEFDLQGLEVGLPFCLVHEHLSDPYLLKDGKRFPVKLGLPVAALKNRVLESLPEDERVLEWQPSAGPRGRPAMTVIAGGRSASGGGGGAAPESVRCFLARVEKSGEVFLIEGTQRRYVGEPVVAHLLMQLYGEPRAVSNKELEALSRPARKFNLTRDGEGCLWVVAGGRKSFVAGVPDAAAGRLECDTLRPEQLNAMPVASALVELPLSIAV